MNGMAALKLPVIPGSAPALVAFSMLSVSLFTFAHNRILSELFGHTVLSMSVNVTFLILALLIGMIATGFMKIQDNRVIRTIMYLSFILYAPAVAAFSRFDILAAAGSSLNFGIFSLGLSSVVVMLCGILLTGGGLLLKSLAYGKAAMQNFSSRGADKAEIYHVLHKNTVLEAKTIAASAIVVLLIALGVSLAEPVLLWILRSSGFIYIIACIGAALIMALTVLGLLMPMKMVRKDKLTRR